MPRTTRFKGLNHAAALAASVSMLVPGLAAPVFAQASDDIAAACSAEFPSDAEAQANCVETRSAEAEGPSEEELARQLEEAAAAEAEAEAAEADAAAAEEAARLEAEAEAAAQAEADAQAAADAEAQAAADEEAARQAEAEAAEAEAAQAEADAQAAADEEAARQAEAEAAAQAEADAAAQAEADAAAQAEAEAAQAEAAQADAEAAEAERLAAEAAEAEAAGAAETEAAESEAPVAEETETVAAPEAAEAQPVEAETAEETTEPQALTAEEETVADTPDAAADEPAEAAVADGTAETEAPAAEENAVAEAPEADTTPLVETPTESAIAEEVAARPEPELTEDEQTAVSQAEVALGSLMGDDQNQSVAAAAAAESDEPAENAQVEESVITAEEVRTSDQDFATQAVVTERDEDEPRFDRNDKIMLGALGALAVGALLVNQNNRSRVVSNSGDRVVVQQDDGSLRVLKDDDVLLRQAGSNVRTERFDDGSTRQSVLREDGSRVVTIRDASMRVLRRDLITANGERYTLIDDTTQVEPVDVSTLPTPVVSTRALSGDPLADALRQQGALDRRFSLAQVRNIPEVRALAPAFDVSTVTFATGSAAIAPEQAGNLRGLANEVLAAIRANPREVFLVEGHTDAVGDAAYNLALSDRRAESLALALNEYFGVPVENLVVQGYGESFLKVQTEAAEEANRRATVRQITSLLQTAAAN